MIVIKPARISVAVLADIRAIRILRVRPSVWSFAVIFVNRNLNAVVKDMYGRLPQAFATLPNQPLEIRRVPIEIQDGASNGYYNRAALDGSRPAIAWARRRTSGVWNESLP